MPQKHVVTFTDEQRQEVLAVVHSGRASARKITRARVLLKSEAGLTDEEIVEALDVGLATVERVRKRFAQRGLSAALDAAPQPQPQRPQRRVLDGVAEAHLMRLACSTPPDGHGHWTLDLLADRMVQLHVVEAVSRDTVGRCLKKTSSSPGASRSSGASRPRPAARSCGTWRTC